MRQQPPNELGAWVRSRRAHLRLRQADVAERMGPEVETNYVTKVETGRVKVPQQPFLAQLAHALRVSEIDLLRAAGVITEPAPTDGTDPPAADAFPPGSDAARLVTILIDTDPALHLLFLHTVQGVLEMWQRQPWSVDVPAAPTPVASES